MNYYEPRYKVVRYRYGWIVFAPPGRQGIALPDLSEVGALFPDGAVMHPGIAHHWNASAARQHSLPGTAVLAVAMPADVVAWENEIRELLKHRESYSRWWEGTDVGASSAALFAVFCPHNFKYCANHVGRRMAPWDADDFGRCRRLLDQFPEWRARLADVAAAYPETAWPRLVPRWAELEAASLEEQRRILLECHADNQPTTETGERKP